MIKDHFGGPLSIWWENRMKENEQRVDLEEFVRSELDYWSEQIVIRSEQLESAKHHYKECWHDLQFLKGDEIE